MLIFMSLLYEKADHVAIAGEVFSHLIRKWQPGGFGAQQNF